MLGGRTEYIVWMDGPASLTPHFYQQALGKPGPHPVTFMDRAQVSTAPNLTLLLANPSLRPRHAGLCHAVSAPWWTAHAVPMTLCGPRRCVFLTLAHRCVL